jgi:RIO kinase 1
LSSTRTVTELSVPELQLFADELWITDVLYELKSGKEATAYCCSGGATSGAELLAAKVYRPIESRGFRNDAVYQEGRTDAMSRRDRLAYERKTRFGMEMRFGAWVEHEYKTLERLHAAGADVPRPVYRTSEAVLMEFIGDEDGPAPALYQIQLDPDEAPQMFRRLLWNIEKFLACDSVHGDLSAYNVLYHAGRAVIIDVPQSVDPSTNQNAAALLERDISNVCAYFRKAGVRSDPARIASELWMRYQFGDLRRP